MNDFNYFVLGYCFIVTLIWAGLEKLHSKLNPKVRCIIFRIKNAIANIVIIMLSTWGIFYLAIKISELFK